MSKEPQPVLKSMEQVLKDVYEKHRTVVNPDDNWATWETCVEDGTVNVCYEAMSDWANQCTIGLSARLDWQINQSFKQSEEISTLQKTIEEQKKEIERITGLMMDSFQAGLDYEAFKWTGKHKDGLSAFYSFKSKHNL